MEENFNQFLSKSVSTISITDFCINLFLCYLFSYILKIIYIKYGNSLSSRTEFSKNFNLLSLTTMLIITIVKSSLALSLGLVGALSIVRFRSAIKEPEELTFLFLCIAIGLGFGAGQTLITIVGFIFIVITKIIPYYTVDEGTSTENMYLTIEFEDKINVQLNDISKILDRYCNFIELKRLDENSNSIEINYIVSIEDHNHLLSLKNDLYDIHKNLKLTFIDSK